MKNLILLFSVLLIISCEKESSKINEDYKSDIETYRAKLHEVRKQGYLKLTGLHKLDSINTFGSSKENNIVFDVIDTPENLGSITVADSLILFEPNVDVRITTKEDSVLTKMPLKLDKYGSSVRMYYKHVNWQVITRSGSLYLRVWDEKNPTIETFKGFEFFDLNEDFILQGEFTYYDEAKTQSVKTQLGVNANASFVGKVSFNYKGKKHSLDVGANGFLMIADKTTGESTYGGGRYIYLDLPKEDGIVEIDFNKLYNPPCSYNDFTTCSYPPRQNYLEFPVLAGETITSINYSF